MQLDEGLSDPVIDRYLHDDDPDLTEFSRRVDLVHGAISAILNMTWLQLYDHWDEVTIPTAVAMALTPEEIMVWRVNLERPGLLQVLYVGRAPLRP